MALAALWMMPSQAAQLVRIGAAHFPPYTVRPESGADTGLLPQLVEALNALQNDYQFVLVPTSIPRRFGDFKQGRVDMAIFENPDWGWKDIPHTSVDMGLEDAEIFVAQRQHEGQPVRQQNYFADLTGKRLAMFSGYHYEFAGFNADPKFLAQNYNATLTYSHDSNLLMVLRGRADIALVTRSYLSDYFCATTRSPINFWCPSASIRSITITRSCVRPRPSAARHSASCCKGCGITVRC
jgi:ABC-type amino acid transport substrate-binding protein